MIPRVIIRLSLLAILWLASAAVAQERDSADRSNMAPDATAKPGPDQHDGDQEPGKETKTEPMEPTIATSTSICLLVELAAQAHGLPFEFFGRLIWQESGFKPNAVGPMTRSGQRAQGVAQFMPGTASDRGLFDLFDPVAALPKSAEFLAELHAEFGNLGLAAAAYNAGPQRVRDWIAGRGGLPAETRNYVIAITGRSADEWAAGNRDHNDVPPTKKTSCGELIVMLKEQQSRFVGELERRVREGAARPWGVELSAGFRARSRTGCLCDCREDLSEDSRKSRSYHHSKQVPKPRHAHILSGSRRRRHAGKRRETMRRAPQSRRYLSGAAQLGWKSARAVD